MKKTIGIMFALFLFASISACSADSSPKTISAAEGKAMMEDDENIILIDVRTESEFLESHIAGAILVPLDSISTLASQKMSDMNATYIVYCRSGRRSAEAVALLDEMGYTSLYDMGGIINWSYGTVSGND